ncbi:spore coat protein GerQ [Virgibacillus xinjiangensis]|uniref:Spore coat protein GerQ n=1 Tax=Virgibacillus xinjiangensis TaxID=393090 RepID=A0ABV7CQR2_9BACI
MSNQYDDSKPQYNNSYQAYPYYYYPQGSPAYYPAFQSRQIPPQGQQGQQGQQQQMQQMQQMQPPQQTGLPMEQSYIENILRLNRGKQARVYMTFENGGQGESRTFTGVIEEAGRDHIVLHDTETGRWYLLLMIYLDYVEFNEEINYSYPFGGTSGQFSAYSPR